MAVEHFHLAFLANQAVTEVRQQLSHRVHGRRGQAVDPARAHRLLLLRAASLEDAQLAKERLEELVQASKQPETIRF